MKKRPEFLQEIRDSAKAEGQDGCLYGYALAASLFAIGTLAIVLAYTIC